MKKPFNWLLLVVPSLFMACSGKDKKVLEVTGTLKNLDKITGSFNNVVSNGKVKLALYEIQFGGEAAPVLLDTISIPVDQQTFHLRVLP